MTPAHQPDTVTAVHQHLLREPDLLYTETLQQALALIAEDLSITLAAAGIAVHQLMDDRLITITDDGPRVWRTPRTRKRQRRRGAERSIALPNPAVPKLTLPGGPPSTSQPHQRR